MLRIVSSLCRANAKYGALTKVSTGAIISTRNTSDSVKKASAEARAEAKKDLMDVVACIGENGPYSSTTEPEYDEAFVQKWAYFFNRPQLDSWEIRRGIHVLVDYDTVPDPLIVIAVLKACRRLNDYALATRFLEVVREKMANHFDKVNPWMMQEIGPTMEELGISTLEELGYHKPELAIADLDDIH